METFKAANKQRAGESVADHFLRCLEYNEAQGATAKGGIGPPIKEQEFKTKVRGPLKNSKLAEAIEFDATCTAAVTHMEPTSRP